MRHAFSGGVIVKRSERSRRISSRIHILPCVILSGGRREPSAVEESRRQTRTESRPDVSTPRLRRCAQHDTDGTRSGCVILSGGRREPSAVEESRRQTRTGPRRDVSTPQLRCSAQHDTGGILSGCVILSGGRRKPSAVEESRRQTRTESRPDVSTPQLRCSAQHDTGGARAGSRCNMQPSATLPARCFDSAASPLRST